MMKFIQIFLSVFFQIFIIFQIAIAQTDAVTKQETSLTKNQFLNSHLDSAKISLSSSISIDSIELINLDLNEFPNISLVLKISPSYLEQITLDKIQVYQNGKLQAISTIEPVSHKNKIPIDFVFVLDKTSSMSDKIDVVKKNVKRFVSNLVKKGIDYKLGLIAFSDIVDSIYSPTNNIYKFIEKLSPIKAEGGGDFPENALDALFAAYKYPFRNNAKRIIILITDATFHVKDDGGDAQTDFTLKSIIDTSKFFNAINYCIVPKQFTDYDSIALSTNGKTFNITENFNSMLDSLSDVVTNFFVIKYQYNEEKLPDSVSIDIINKNSNQLVTKKISSLIDVNKKIVLESNVLFDFAKSELKSEYIYNIDRVAKMLNLRKSIEVSINGYTDDIGSDEYNYSLSLARANSVRAYLVKSGIDLQRIQTQGFGKNQPISPNDTEEGRQSNRRIEIVITKK